MFVQETAGGHHSTVLMHHSHLKLTYSKVVSTMCQHHKLSALDGVLGLLARFSCASGV